MTPSVRGPRKFSGSFCKFSKPASGSNLPFLICSHIERISKANFRNFHACVCVCVCVCVEICCVIITVASRGVLMKYWSFFPILYVVFVRVLFIVLCYYCWYKVPFLSLATWLMSHLVNKRELYYYHHHHHHRHHHYHRHVWEFIDCSLHFHTLQWSNQVGWDR